MDVPLLNRSMNLQQIIEGQAEQIANLSPNTPVTLFYATDIDEATGIILDHASENYYPVYPSLKHAARQGDVAIQFYGLGRHLEAPRTIDNSTMVQQKYQHSSKPVVSAKMLSMNPMVYYTAPIFRDKIEQLFVMQNGQPEEFSIREFMQYAIGQKANQRKAQHRRWA